MDLTILFQGPIITDNNITYRCIKSVEQNFPDTKIILSTWLECKKDINEDFKKISNLSFVFSDDPGGHRVRPNSFLNVNRLIVSSQEGLKNVKTEYTLKIRSDIFFKNRIIIDYFQKYKNIDTGKKYKIYKERILFSNQTFLHPNRIPILYHPCDWLVMGKTESLVNMFEIPLMENSEFTWFLNKKKPEDSLTPGNLSRYMSEDYLGFKFVKKHFSDACHEDYYDFSRKDYDLWINLIKNNFIIMPNKMMGLVSLKYLNLKNYHLYKSWSFYEWEKLVFSKNNLLKNLLNTSKMSIFTFFNALHSILFFIRNSFK